MKQLLIYFLLFLIVSSCGQHAKRTVNADAYYTCPMHPQVIAQKPGKCPICHMQLTQVSKPKQADKHDDALVLSDQQIQLGNIQVDTLTTSSIGSQLVLTGTINFDQSKRTSISARIMGRIEKLYYKNIGDYVPKGAPVYELYSEDLNNAKQEYLLALERRKTFQNNTVIDFAALLQSARAKLQLWGMSSAQIKALERSGKASSTTTFYSTASGYITELNSTEGAYIMEGAPVLQLADLSTLWVEAQVYSSQLASITSNSTAMVQIPGTGIKEKGRVTFVNPELNPGSRLNLIRISIPNTGNQLKPGMPAYIMLNTEKQAALTLPIDAVIQETNAATVWVKTAPHTFKNMMVTVGRESDEGIEVLSGLQAGDVVVVSGAYLLNSEFIFKHGANPMAGHKH